jgi:hypothetical protein
MDRVIGVFQAVADEHGCSVEIVHHTRKGAAGQGDVMQGGDDMCGSSSIQGAVRSQRMVSVMPAAEAARLRIPEADRRRHIRITNEKTNYAPPAHGGWFKLASVELPNGDCVGVVEPWRHPDEGGEITPEMAAMKARSKEVFIAILTASMRLAGRLGRHLRAAMRQGYSPRSPRSCLALRSCHEVEPTQLKYMSRPIAEASTPKGERNSTTPAKLMKSRQNTSSGLFVAPWIN